MTRKQNVRPQQIVRKDGSEVWRVRFRLTPGSNPVSDTFPTYEEADQYARIVNTAGGQAARHARQIADSGGIRSIDTALEDYLAHAGTSAQTSTLEKYRRDWRLRIEPTFKGWPVQAISRPAVEAWIVTLRDTETQQSQRLRARDPSRQPDYLSPKTIAVAHGLLSAVLKHEVLSGHLDTNPAFGVKLPGRRKKREPVFLSQSDYAAIAGVIDPKWEDLLHLLAGTGMRWGEATALRPEDFDLDGPVPVVRISDAWKRGATGGAWIIGAPKTQAGHRTVSLTQPVVAALAERLQRTPPGALLFEGPNGGRLQGEWFRERVWGPAVEASKIGRNPRIHDLRHSHASWLIAEGVPLTYIQRRLGHESIKTTSDTYGHLAPDAWAATAAATERAMTLALPVVEDGAPPVLAVEAR